MAITAVFFDVGGTLVDETRLYTDYAARLGVPPGEFHAALGATIQAALPHRKVFEMLAPDVDLAALRAERKAEGKDFSIEPDDLYPDALACLTECRAAGLFVGVAGNQPLHAEAALAACGVSVDVLAASDRWGVAKPDPRFFALVAESCNRSPGEIAYVGDRVDNDVIPAAAAGMVPVLLVRGPFGVVQAAWPEADQAALRLRSLLGLPARLAALDLSAR